MKRALLLFSVLLFMVLCFTQTRTQTPIHVTGFKSGATPTPTPPVPFVLTQTLGTLQNPSEFEGYLGFRFTTATAPVVTALCRWKVAGSTQTHTVKIFEEVDGGSSDVEKGSVSIDLSSGGFSDGAYACVDLGSPLTLSSSTVHYIYSREFSGGDGIYTSATIDSTTSGVASAIHGSVYLTPPTPPGRSLNAFGDINSGLVNFKVQQ